MSFNNVAILSIRRRRFPTVLDAALEQFVRGRMFVPDGDRRHSSKSRRVINEEHAAIGNDDIVREFVLSYHLSHDLLMNIRLRLRRRPGENIRQTFVTSDVSMIGIAQTHV